MKVSALIEYLKKYLQDNGDVDLDVEFAGAPKTPPPVQDPIPTPEAMNDLAEIFRKILEEKKKFEKKPQFPPDDLWSDDSIRYDKIKNINDDIKLPNWEWDDKF